jgi:hypothetical protein
MKRMENVERGYFLLIASYGETIEGKKVPSQNIAARRLDAGQWSLYAKTPHRSEIKSGDELIVYVAGPTGRKFIARATAGDISSNWKNYALDDDILNEPPVAVLFLKNVEYFSRSVLINDIKSSLDFFPKNTNKWGCVFQRGAKRISESDANKILKNAGLETVPIGANTQVIPLHRNVA